MSARCILAGSSVPRLPRHVKFRFDTTRQSRILLAPERLLLPDEIAVAVLDQVDGKRSIDAIVDLLAVKFEAPREEIAADVLAMLQDLADKGYVVA